MAKNIGELFVSLKLDSSKFQRGLSEAEGSLSRVGKSLTSLGKRLTLAAGASLLAIGTIAIKVGGTFEQKLTNAFSVTGAASEDVKKQMEELARTMGKTTVFSASQAADAMYYMASAGWKANDMAVALKPTLALAAATQSDLAFTTNVVVSALNQPLLPM